MSACDGLITLTWRTRRLLVQVLGARLGNSFYNLTEQFHHVVWLGDLNYRCRCALLLPLACILDFVSLTPLCSCRCRLASSW
jgi:hypothetical protein